jgi:hypothetical protein
MNELADILRSYARILRMPKREYDPVFNKLVERQPGEIIMAAADALDFKANAIDRGLVEKSGEEGS